MLTKFTLKKAGVRQLLRTHQAEMHLRSIAEQMAAEMGEGYEADSTIGRNRARATVAAVSIEARLEQKRTRSLQRLLTYR